MPRRIGKVRSAMTSESNPPSDPRESKAPWSMLMIWLLSRWRLWRFSNPLNIPGFRIVNLFPSRCRPVNCWSPSNVPGSSSDIWLYPRSRFWHLDMWTKSPTGRCVISFALRTNHTQWKRWSKLPGSMTESLFWPKNRILSHFSSVETSLEKKDGILLKENRNVLSDCSPAKAFLSTDDILL